MRKNKRLKKELLLYKKQIILGLNELVLNKKNKEELNYLIGDVSLANEIISVRKKINAIEDNINNTLLFPIGSEFISVAVINDYFSANKYYEELLNEIIKHKFNSKKIK